MLKSSYLKNLNGCRDPTNSLRAQWFNFNELFGSGIRLLGNCDTTCVSELLKTVCEVHVWACRIIGLVNPVFYRLNNDFACVHANSDLQIRIAQARHSILHCQSGEATANSMILMRLRSTK